MTTTKKKAPTLADAVAKLQQKSRLGARRITALERYAQALFRDAAALLRLHREAESRITTLEQAQRPTGLVDDDGRLACAKCGLVPLDLRASGHTLCWECHNGAVSMGPAPVAATPETEKPAPPPAHPWATPQPIETLPKSGRAMLHAKGWGWANTTLHDDVKPHKDWDHWMPEPPPPDAPAWQEARLRDAVVEAARITRLDDVMPDELMAALDALDAHRAKKGGA